MAKTLGAMAICILFAAVNANASCISRTMSSERLGYFMDNPGDLLDKFPNGTDMMSFQVTELASSSVMTLKPLQSIFPNTNASQREVIGDGLARAYRACKSKSSDQARAIRELVLKSGNSDIALSFMRHSNDSDDDSGRLNPRTTDSDLFRGQWDRTSGSSNDGSKRSSTYLSGTGGMDMEPNSRQLKLNNPFAPVQILKR